MAGKKPNWFIAFPVAASGWFDLNHDNTPLAIRPLHPADLHITVAFLGATSRRKAARAWKEAIKLSLPPITVSFNQLKPFGAFATPSAYGLTLELGREELVAVIEDHQASLLSIVGKKPRNSRTVPHVTIARPRRRLTRKDVFDIAEWRRDFNVPRLRLNLDELALYTWASPSAPQRFEAVKRIALQEDGG